MTSWLSPVRWLAVGVLLAALFAGYGFWAKHQQGIGYSKAQDEYRAQAVRTDVQRASIAPPLAAKQEVAQARIRTVTKTIIEKVPEYVPIDSCALPGGFRRLHDAAANGVLPDPAGIADAAPVPAHDVAESVVSNYGTCHEIASRLAGLQSWIIEQQALK